MQEIITQLVHARDRAKKDFILFSHAIKILSGKNRISHAPHKRREISAAGKRRIIAAQKKRWKIWAAKRAALTRATARV